MRKQEVTTGRVRSWVGAHLAVTLTVAGLVIYGIGRLYLTAEYDTLGVTPDEIGFSYQETIAASIAVLTAGIVGLALWLVIGAAAVAIVVLLIHLLQRQLPGFFAHARKEIGELIPVLVVAYLVFVSALAVGVIVKAHRAGEEVAAGRVLGTRRLFGVPLVPIAPRPAFVSAASARVPLPANVGRLRGSCVFYLGSAHGFTFLYSASNRHTYRVPSALLTVDVGPDVGKLSNCR